MLAINRSILCKEQCVSFRQLSKISDQPIINDNQKQRNSLVASTPLNGNLPFFTNSSNHLNVLFSSPVISTGAPSLGVPGVPFVPAFSDSPILSIHVPQLYLLPPRINPVLQSTCISILNPSSLICISRFGPALYSRKEIPSACR